MQGNWESHWEDRKLLKTNKSTNKTLIKTKTICNAITKTTWTWTTWKSYHTYNTEFIFITLLGIYEFLDVGNFTHKRGSVTNMTAQQRKNSLKTTETNLRVRQTLAVIKEASRYFGQRKKNHSFIWPLFPQNTKLHWRSSSDKKTLFASLLNGFIKKFAWQCEQSCQNWPSV